MSETSSKPDLAGASRTEAVIGLVKAAFDAGDLEKAMRLADEAVSNGLAHPLLFNLAAHLREKRHRYEEAIPLLERGLELDPNELSMLTALGLCWNKLTQPARAMAAFDAVLAVDPDFAPAHYGKGAAFTSMGEFEAARRHFLLSSTLPPPYADPLGSLAALDARLGDMQSARQNAERALRLDPANAAGLTALAICENDTGAFPAAEALSRRLATDESLASDDRAAAMIVLGDALNGQERVDEAVAAYTEAKALQRGLVASQFERPGLETYPQLLRRLYDWMTALPEGGFRPQSGEDHSGAAGHVFVIGFARSGTTLLETALAGHPGVVALDERDSLRTAAMEAFESNEALDRLARLEAADASRMRDAYWDRVAHHGAEVKGKVFVDKAPFAASMLPAIAALFPKAKVLFAIRDPRDVVLSCFRRNFVMNPTTYQFGTLESTARCYDDLMRLAMLFRERLPLQVHDLVYERLTGDFEAEARQICTFVGLEWSTEIANFADTARTRPSRTPSARQLVRGLYRGEGQWRPYAKHFEPVLPILKPWLDRFGYEA
jgi:tetratricopeptide (TPR) repeat protein